MVVLQAPEVARPAHGGSRGRGGSRLGSAVARPPSLRPGSSNGPDTAALLGAIAAFAEPSPEEFERLRQTEREIMHEKSRNWTSTWTGTLQGQRTQALVAHEVRQASDEAQRCAADELHASEMAKQRASAVQRARDMQLAGTEEARNVAYEVRKAAVMEERDRQVQFKHSGYAAAAGLADISDAAGATKSKIALTAIGESAEPIVIVGPAGRDLAAQLATARETAAAARRQEIEADRAVAEADARARDEADAHRAATDRESKRIQRAALDAQTSHRTRLQGQLQAEEREIEQAGAQWTACKLSLAQKVAAIEVERRGTRMSVAEQLGTQSARKAQEVREKAEITLAATVKKREEDMAERNRQEAERRTGAARDLKNYFDHHVERQRLFKEQSARESQQTRTQLITDADADKHERELRALERKLEAMELAKAHREQISYKESRERELVREEHEKAKRAIPNPVQAYSEEEMSSFMGRHFLELQQGTPLVGLPLPKPPASAGGSRVVMEAGSAEAAALRLAVPTPPPFRAAVIKPVSKDSVTQPAANVKPPWMRSVAARRGGKRGGARI
ncbi:hypothetical protein BC828DRAFT_171262 [Blastocladiella britannica]|nr:hypothetical protein BC828DRAFT_171262 [Blastocladiella britannica]